MPSSSSAFLASRAWATWSNVAIVTSRFAIAPSRSSPGPLSVHRQYRNPPGSHRSFTMTPHDAHAELVRRAKELGVLNSCAAVLAWDQQTYVPQKAGALRGEQMAFLASLAHQKFTDPKVGEL